MPTAKQKFVLLDRDGVINRRIAGGYVTSWKDFEFLPWALQGLRLLAEHGYAALVVSNQACVGKGLLSEKELYSITKRFVAEVAAAGGNIRSVYYCTHRADAGCACRKPQTGLLLKAQSEHNFNFADTFVIGDSASDIEASRRVGASSVLVTSETGARNSAFPCSSKIVGSLYEGAEIVIVSELDTVSTFAGRETRAMR